MNVEHKLCKELVGKFVKNPRWPREIKIAKTLLSQCPDIEAWFGLNLSGLPSLAYFLTEEGSMFIPTSQKNPYLLDLSKLENKKIDKTQE